MKQRFFQKLHTLFFIYKLFLTIFLLDIQEKKKKILTTTHFR